MFDFILEGGSPQKGVSVWSNQPLQGLSAGVLTPFSGSVLCEIAARAIIAYHERIGLASPPREEIVRLHNGSVYLNLSALAQSQLAQAGIEPPTLRFNGELLPLAKAEKRSLFSTLRNGRTQKKIDDVLDDIGQHIDTTSRAASYWLQQTRDRQWTQADLLQVMEEIERKAVDSMVAYFAARYNLDLLYNRLIVASLDTIEFPASLGLINGALSDIDSLVETSLATALVDLAEELATDRAKRDALVQWLQRNSFDEWEQTAPDRETVDGLYTFLATYGHRAVDEAEMARPRWYEDPVPVMHGLLSLVNREAKGPVRTPTIQSVNKLLAHVDAATAKALPSILERMYKLHHLQSHALHALAYVWAGTREWAKAAAREAVTDGRLQKEDDVFFFELEEIKQMMTGEWNITDLEGIRSTVGQRRSAYGEWINGNAPSLFVDDRPASVAVVGLPGSAGQVTAPLRRLKDSRTDDCRGAVLGTEHLDSGWALVLPTADGFIASTGTPVDSLVTAARAWHRPSVLSIGQEYEELVEGAMTTLDGDLALVDQ